MKQYVTKADVARALGVSPWRVHDRVEHLPSIPAASGKAKLYPVGAIIAGLKWTRHRPLAGSLIKLAGPHPSMDLYVGGAEMLAHGAKLCTWLARDVAQVARLREAQGQFAAGLASAPELFERADVRTLQTLLPLSGHVLPFLITGDRRNLPQWDAFSRAFAVAHMGVTLSGSEAA